MRLSAERPTLLKLLGDKKPRIRAEAVVGLGVLGNRDDLEALQACVTELPWDKRSRGVLGLALLGDPRAIPFLEELANSLPKCGAKKEIEAGDPKRNQRSDPTVGFWVNAKRGSETGSLLRIA